MIKDTYSKSSKISCTYLGDLHTEAKHTLSLSIIRANPIKDRDAEGKDVAPTNLLVPLWEIGKIKIDVYKTIKSEVPWKIKNCVINSYVSNSIFKSIKIFQKIACEFPVKLKF